MFKPARAPGSPVGGVGGQLTQPARSVPPIQGISVPPTQPGISAGPTGQGLPAAGSGGQGGSVPPGMMADGALQAFQAQTKGDTFYVQLIGRLRPGRQGKGGDKNGDGNRDGSGEETVSYLFSSSSSFSGGPEGGYGCCEYEFLKGRSIHTDFNFFLPAILEPKTRTRTRTRNTATQKPHLSHRRS